MEFGQEKWFFGKFRVCVTLHFIHIKYILIEELHFCRERVRPNCTDLQCCCGGLHCLYGVVWVVAYRAYAIRPYKWRKAIIAHSFQNTPKTTSDVGKTMSYVEKIMSDIIKTTSDLFSAFASP